MKKFLKIVGIVILSLIVLVLVAGLIAPKKYHIEREITINAPREKVWSHVSNLEECHKWNPWSEEDPNIKVSYAGNLGTVGSSYSYTSEKVGAGTQTLTKVDQPQRVESHMKFIKPFDGDADIFINLQDAGAGTKVTWGFDTQYSYPMNAMLLVMPMDKMMSESYDKGLNNLKRISESN
ncbi:SRPBCC family protein [Paraflavitalea sp. CAU 1676]|uniref:SRPBCC family protein n=1 Tax=Paraflavitalea sp. CAU 1676 TaxID=3032598 RepID=UPI0023DB39C3|nr:SRPBCC family protein [Paraflavitalea sp. CAU 1676]MDF2189052.1 SRPBCC family protein [Paraflavitalea sp. CAU 1676]